jgi:hypothetical protein
MSTLFIEQVANGWVVRPDPYSSRNMNVDTTGTWWVFNRIEDLCVALPALLGVSESVKQRCLNEADLAKKGLTETVKEKVSCDGDGGSL